MADSVCVGTCAFKSAPRANRVEIAYFTFPGFERRGFATQMAQLLVRIAAKTQPGIAVVSQTLAEENASTVILKKLGFTFDGPREHPEDGQVWEWWLQTAPQG